MFTRLWGSIQWTFHFKEMLKVNNLYAFVMLSLTRAQFPILYVSTRALHKIGSP